MTSPKQPPSPAARDWYPYYAGYTEDFVRTTLTSELPRARSVLDPWHGSGTTVAACVKSGVTSLGVDLNPALTVIAKARLTPASTSESLLPLARKIVATARAEDPRDVRDSDPLAQWIRTSGVARIRSIQSAIHAILCEESAATHLAVERVEALPILASFFYTALFAGVRDLLARFRTTNPMWLKAPETGRHRVDPSWEMIARVILDRVLHFRERLSVGDDLLLEEARIVTGTADALPAADRSFDAALTSPPYATRLDYIKGTLPELAVLGASEEDLARLRQLSTGSPVVRGANRGDITDVLSPYGRRLVERIGAHSSKGSRSYYAPWMLKYLTSLQRGLAEICRVVRPLGPVGVVVQDSYYKAEHVDLQLVIVETMREYGRSLSVRRDFRAKMLRSRMNPRARAHLSKRQNHESLLVFC